MRPLGIVPRVPLLNLIGLPTRPDAFGPLPSGIRATSFERRRRPTGGDGIDARDASSTRSIARSSASPIPVDHRFLRQENRRGWLYAGPDGAPLAYGYATEAGRVGPVAVRDPDLLAPILGHLTTAVTPRGAFALWLPGTADRAVVTGALQAGIPPRPVPGPAVLGPAVRRPVALPADLPRTPLDPTGPDHRPGPASPLVRLPARWARW